MWAAEWAEQLVERAAHILWAQAVLPIGQLPTSSLHKLFCPFSCPHPLWTSCSAQLAAHILSPQAVGSSAHCGESCPHPLSTSCSAHSAAQWAEQLFCPLGSCPHPLWTSCSAHLAAHILSQTSCSAHWAAAQILSGTSCGQLNAQNSCPHPL